MIQFYDSDRHFPAWGFGGRKRDGSVSHCFNLSGDESHYEVFKFAATVFSDLRLLFKVAFNNN